MRETKIPARSPLWAARRLVRMVAVVVAGAVHRWTMSRIPVGSIGPLPPPPGGAAGNTAAVAADARPLASVTLAGHTRGLHDWCSFPKGNRFRAENVREALGSPGSWYLDRPTGTLTYCPLPGETPDGTVVVAPRLDSLVEITGDPAGDRPVEHVRLEGLGFAHGNWSPPPGGQSYAQAEINVGAAVSLTDCRQVAFDRVAVVHVGRYAIELGSGCRDWQLERTRVEPHTSFTFRRNIVWWDTAALLMKGEWTKGLAMDHNCYWNAAGPVTFPGRQSLAERQAASA